MAPPNTRDDIAAVRQMHQALVLHYVEGKTQAEIAGELGLSHATVNRLIKRGHQLRPRRDQDQVADRSSG